MNLLCIQFNFQPPEVEDDLYQEDDNVQTAVGSPSDYENANDSEETGSDENSQCEIVTKHYDETSRLEIYRSEELCSFTNKAFYENEAGGILVRSIDTPFVMADEMLQQTEHSGSTDGVNNCTNSCVSFISRNLAETYV